MPSCGPDKFKDAVPLCVGRGPSGKAFKHATSAYYTTNPDAEVESISSIPIEKVIRNFNPVAVLSLPIFYTPDASHLEGQKPVLGVLSIILNTFNKRDYASDKMKQSLYFFDPMNSDDLSTREKIRETGQKTVDKIARIISEAVSEIFTSSQ